MYVPELPPIRPIRECDILTHHEELRLVAEPLQRMMDADVDPPQEFIALELGVIWMRANFERQERS